MILQFKIQIEDITKPPVWRKVLVPETFTFHRFHNVIQAAFGWTNSHFYHFSDRGYGSGEIIGIPSDDDWMPVTDSNTKKLKDVFSKEGKRYTYIYDLGDDWVHKIILEKIIKEKGTKATCIDGKGACPPENCGGVWGYEEMKEVLVNKPDSEQAEELRDWLGLGEDETLDTNTFDLQLANTLVEQVK
ncbi:MAG: plasmid pRiA4b ORF-3 family protein [Prevotellaceae bacterium]|jgi:hypothetical protein|nr:plasmid pRiA4b ORF-3 family protein [Prevotellaceae bacterium]